jgi:hypothetical protein
MCETYNNSMYLYENAIFFLSACNRCPLLPLKPHPQPLSSPWSLTLTLSKGEGIGIGSLGTVVVDFSFGGSKIGGMTTITFKQKLPANLANEYQNIDQFMIDYNTYSTDTYVEFWELTEDEVAPILRAKIEAARAIPTEELINI